MAETNIQKDSCWIVKSSLSEGAVVHEKKNRLLKRTLHSDKGKCELKGLSTHENAEFD